jgi:hypothetical protein
MRVPVQDAPGNPDNRGFVVSHVGLNVDKWWDELKELDKEDQEFYAELASADGERALEVRGEGAPESRARFKPEMLVLEEEIQRFVERGFLPEDSRALVDDMVRMLELRGISLETMGLTRNALEARLIERLPSREQEGAVSRAFVQPQRARQVARQRLEERARAAGKQLLNELELKVTGRELVRRYPVYQSVNNLTVAIILINLAIQRHLGVGGRARDMLSIDELRRAHDEMDSIVDEAVLRVRGELGGGA